MAILAVDNTYIDKNHCIRATYGNTKYCENYLKKKKCTIKDCLYVHSNNSQEVIVERDELNKVSYRDLRLRAAKMANIFDPEFKKKLLSSEIINNSILPSVHTIYNKPPISWNEQSYHNNSYSYNNEYCDNYWQKERNNISNKNGKVTANGLKDLICNSVNNNDKSNNNQNLPIETEPITSNTAKNVQFSKCHFHSKEENENEIESKNDFEAIAKTKTNSDEDSSNENENFSMINDITETESNNRNNIKISNSEDRIKQSCFVPNLENSDENVEGCEIPEVIIRIIKNSQKNNYLSNNRFSKICELLRKEILNFSAVGIGATKQESEWANYILEYSKEI